MTAPAPPVRSTVRRGSLVIGATEFAVGQRAVSVKPSISKDGDDLEFLDGANLAAERKSTFTLEGSGIQMFDDPDGFQAFCHAHNGETMAFTFRPNDKPAGVQYAGEIVVQALLEGGDVGADPGDVSWSFEGVGFYTRTYLAGA